MKKITSNILNNKRLFLDALNQLALSKTKLDSLKVYGNGSAKHTPKSLQINVGKKGKGGGTTTTSEILFGTITQTLTYDSETGLGNSTYEVDIDDVGITVVTLWDAVGVDLRNFCPFLTLGSYQPILLYSGTYYFLSNSFLYVGIESQKSISFNEELGITQAVFS